MDFKVTAAHLVKVLKFGDQSATKHQVFMKFLEKRRKMVFCPVVLAASLSSIEVQEAMQHIGEINKYFLPQVSKLIGRHEPSMKTCFQMLTKTYRLLRGGTQAENLASPAILLLAP